MKVSCIFIKEMRTSSWDSDCKSQKNGIKIWKSNPDAISFPVLLLNSGINLVYGLTSNFQYPSSLTILLLGIQVENHSFLHFLKPRQDYIREANSYYLVLPSHYCGKCCNIIKVAQPFQEDFYQIDVTMAPKGSSR